MSKDLGLYIHIPFCVRKCRYCDFTSFAGTQSQMDSYIAALRAEMTDAGDEYPDRYLDSIYIGGGTPSLMQPGVIADLCDLAGRIWDIDEGAEISIEINPGTADPSKLSEYRRAGINRLSIGVQSVSDEELATLGRIHTSEDFLRIFDQARAAGFENINTDLISAVPGQTCTSLERNLETICSLGPEHISVYSLQLEEGTYMYDHPDEFDFIDEDTDRDMYHLTAEVLARAGYERYEISNYCRPGYECRHNMRYWTGGDYLGVGLGAASCMGDVRFRNTDVLLEYMNGVRVTESTPHGRKERIEEYMFLGLRLMRGVSRSRFRELFGTGMDEVYPGVVESLSAKGLVIDDGDRIRLSNTGLDVCNYCLAGFIL